MAQIFHWKIDFLFFSQQFCPRLSSQSDFKLGEYGYLWKNCSQIENGIEIHVGALYVFNLINSKI